MPKWDRLTIYERDRFYCRYCGFDGGTFATYRYLTVDHVNPKGPDEVDNLATCCTYCNSCKSNDPCVSVEQAREIVARHNVVNLVYWESKILPKVRR